MPSHTGSPGACIYTMVRRLHPSVTINLCANRVYSPIKNSRSKTGTYEFNYAPSAFILQHRFDMLRKLSVGSVLLSAGNPSMTLCSRRFTTAGGVKQLPKTAYQVSPREMQEQPVQDELCWPARQEPLRRSWIWSVLLRECLEDSKTN